MTADVEVRIGKCTHRWKVFEKNVESGMPAYRWLVVYLEAEFSVDGKIVKRTLSYEADDRVKSNDSLGWERKVRTAVLYITRGKKNREREKAIWFALDKVRRRMSAYLRKKEISHQRKRVEKEDERASALKAVRDAIKISLARAPGIRRQDVVDAYEAVKKDMTVTEVMES